MKTQSKSEKNMFFPLFHKTNRSNLKLLITNAGLAALNPIPIAKVHVALAEALLPHMIRSC
jgi:hypothetical protein